MFERLSILTVMPALLAGSPLIFIYFYGAVKLWIVLQLFVLKYAVGNLSLLLKFTFGMTAIVSGLLL
jgi:hypothetical protein